MHKTDSCLNVLDEMSLVPKAIRCLFEAALTLSLYKRAVSLNRQLGTGGVVSRLPKQTAWYKRAVSRNRWLGKRELSPETDGLVQEGLSHETGGFAKESCLPNRQLWYKKTVFRNRQF
jgi:hypothetical protein